MSSCSIWASSLIDHLWFYDDRFNNTKKKENIIVYSSSSPAQNKYNNFLAPLFNLFISDKGGQLRTIAFVLYVKYEDRAGRGRRLIRLHILFKRYTIPTLYTYAPSQHFVFTLHTFQLTALVFPNPPTPPNLKSQLPWHRFPYIMTGSSIGGRAGDDGSHHCIKGCKSRATHLCIKKGHLAWCLQCGQLGKPFFGCSKCRHKDPNLFTDKNPHMGLSKQDIAATEKQQEKQENDSKSKSKSKGNKRKSFVRK